MEAQNLAQKPGADGIGMSRTPSLEGYAPS